MMLPRDDQEAISLLEPCLIRQNSPIRTTITDLALELSMRSSELKGGLPSLQVPALATLVRSMNCYYSNLIEGHDTHPVDIERALSGDYSDDQEKRDLQLEAKAHISVQQWIDEGGLTEWPTAPSSLQAIHRRFCEQLPEEYLWVDEPSSGRRLAVQPGEFRHQDVVVGRHVAISPGAVPRFLGRLNKVYLDQQTSKVNTLLSIPCAHHRLLWVHPFLDGNGRVVRLVSYAMLRDALDTQGLWSVARGLARRESDYKKHLAACDQARMGDLDGRGHLSERALVEFVAFFLEVCIDQVKFMQELMEPSRLRERILGWVDEEVRNRSLPAKSDLVMKEVLYKGELNRSEVVQVVGASDRTARRLTAALIEKGALVAESDKAPLRLNFPATLAPRWMPKLFPER